ncbi:hypothetical protein B484DRAFT_452614 [Ochromonadaceae sp. CCMP2298]|nr:hypothetical protein B484DRAFT_452614 [Ochromonadaceae sp. CCMP2298]|mmetsp:Transcript_21216/g.47124  ORF Transcript_21216/g.47124 Transcript_21216/m.47124 type:complete len:157 (+) Transcript_21216:25-495(+)
MDKWLKRPAGEMDASVGAKVKPAKQARTKKVKGLAGVGAEDFEHTDLKVLKPILNTHCKSLAKLVADDWHDGWEDQGQEVGEYMDTVAPMLQAVYNISIRSQTGFERCHEIIKTIVDSWENMKSVPMRGTVEEQFPRSQEDVGRQHRLSRVRYHTG